MSNKTRVEQKEWYYFHIEIVQDPLVLQISDLKNHFEKVEVDRITWKTLVASSLKKLYGIIGESSHFDVLHISGKSSIIRIYAEDREMFANSLTSYSTLLNDHFGHSLDAAEVECSLKVQRTSAFVGELITPELIQQ